MQTKMFFMLFFFGKHAEHFIVTHMGNDKKNEINKIYHAGKMFKMPA